MRNFILTLPILALSACSIIDQPYLDDKSAAHYGYYNQGNQGCAASTCAPSQSYSVADQWSGQKSLSTVDLRGMLPIAPLHPGCRNNAYVAPQQPQGCGLSGPVSQKASRYGNSALLRGVSSRGFW